MLLKILIINCIFIVLLKIMLLSIITMLINTDGIAVELGSHESLNGYLLAQGNRGFVLN